ncbi:hypothetical protein XFF6990_10186 [Xanthomonas citri pv. fuscans]|uniref:Uncharacterized protein n=1 Tax=Xanthomonas campestris pv. phaseoli TaxID=317013 RepID=A0A7Z7J3C7_XANCH|nr:hypothetical protein XFF6990_10186 [Xanthomonas citri pv. fuscans]SOO26590.1 hypothetical protein XFF6991_570155 [Xanthomonas phaseoli pv. phaseoli]
MSAERTVYLHAPVPFGKTVWVLGASTEGLDKIPLDNWQLLGIHLVWHLYGIGVVTTHAADGLLDMWHGA